MWTRNQLGLWKDSGTPQKPLRDAVRIILNMEPMLSGRLDSAKYFNLHKELQQDHGLSHEEAVEFISHINLIIDLIQSHGFTSARLGRVLRQLDSQILFSRQSLTDVTQAIKLKPELTEAQLNAVWTRDRNSESTYWADADLASAAEIADTAASDLGFKGSLRQFLLELAPTSDPARFIAHVQMLHYQCIILEFFNHYALDLYEFSPRAEAVSDFFDDNYPSSLVSTGNPFLNNAKSVGTMTRDWAESKKTAERPGARALFSILSGLDDMS